MQNILHVRYTYQQVIQLHLFYIHRKIHWESIGNLLGIHWAGSVKIHHLTKIPMNLI